MKLLSTCFLLLVSTVWPATASSAPAENPPAGSAQIKGVIINYDTKEPMAQTKVRLLRYTGEADKEGWAPVDDRNITTLTSAAGEFVFEHLAAGKYMLMVEAQRMGLPRAGQVRKEDGSRLDVAMEDGQQVDIGKGWVQLR